MKGWVPVAALFLISGRAQATDAVTAEALFARGKSLLMAGDHERACPQLEESFRLDPATGALYALAICHEGQGKLASAWSEFMDVAARSKSERNAEREEAARRHADALEPRLAFLTVNVSTEVAALAGLNVRRDGHPLRSGTWGVPIPVDPGSHVVRVEAPGYQIWTKEVRVDGEGTRETVDVERLVAAKRPEVPRLPSGGLTLRTESPPAPARPLRTVGIALGQAGATALVVAGVATWRALANKANAEDHCPQNHCDVRGIRYRSQALEAADFATGSLIASAVLLGAGATLFVYDYTASRAAERQRTRVSLHANGVEVLQSF